MHFRTLALATSALAVISPAAVFANPDSAALNACAKAFAASVAAPGAAAPSYKLNYTRGRMLTSVDAYYARDYTFYLTAARADSGAAVARATCSADGKGKVLSLTADNDAVAAPTLASR